MAKSAYKRILLKVSGEALSGDQSFGIKPEFLDKVAAQIAGVARSGVDVAIVTGGGNIFRGMSIAAENGDRVTADMMGTLGTIINSLAVASALTRAGVKAKVFSAVTMPSIADSYTARAAKAALDDGYVVVLGGGIANPFFTTDTAAALRGREMGVDIVLKATKVDGVYTADPKKDPKAQRYQTLSYTDVLARDLKVMDASAVSLMRDNKIPIVVFNIRERGNLLKVLNGEGVFTTIA